MVMKYLEGSFIGEWFAWHPIDKESGCENGVPPVKFWDFGIQKKRSSGFNYMTVFSFSNAILLGTIGATTFVHNAIIFQKT